MASASSPIKLISLDQYFPLQTPDQVLKDAKDLFESFLKKINTIIEPAKYKNYFISYARACCSSSISNDKINQAFKKCMEGIGRFALKKDEEELKKISEVGWAVILHITEIPESAIKRASSRVPGPKIVISSKIERLYSTLSKILYAKEYMMTLHSRIIAKNKIIQIEDKQKYFCVQLAQKYFCSDKLCSDHHTAVVVNETFLEHLENSEAFALFCCHYADTFDGGFKQNVLTDKKIQQLKALREGSNRDVQAVADFILIQWEWCNLSFEMGKTSKIMKKIRQDFKRFINHKILISFFPESKNLEVEKEAIPDPSSSSPISYKNELQLYPTIEGSRRCDLAYEMFYEVLSATSKEIYKSARVSYFLKSDRFPSPREFRELSLNYLEEEVALYIEEQQKAEIRKCEAVKRKDIKTEANRRRMLIAAHRRKNKDIPIRPPQTKQDTVLPTPIAVTPFSLPEIQEPQAIHTVPCRLSIIDTPVVPVAPPISLFEQIAAESTYPVDALMYAPRVNLWFENSKAALDNAQQRGMNQMYRDEWVMFHTLPQFLDRLIGTLYCIEGSCENQKGEESDLFSFIGEIVDSSGKASRGVLSIAVDETGVCWHRCWSRRTTSELVNQRMEGALFNIDNPTPAEAALRTGNVKPRRELVDRIEVTMSKAGVMSMPISKEYTLRLFPCHPN